MVTQYTCPPFQLSLPSPSDKCLTGNLNAQSAAEWFNMRSCAGANSKRDCAIFQCLHLNVYMMLQYKRLRSRYIDVNNMKKWQCCHKQLDHWYISSDLPNCLQAILAAGKAWACSLQFFSNAYQIRFSDDCHCNLVSIHWQKVVFSSFDLPERTEGLLNGLYCLFSMSQCQWIF